jgi:hypothetical protein
MDWLAKITLTEIFKKADLVHIISISFGVICLLFALHIYQTYNKFMIKQLKQQQAEKKHYFNY